MFRQLQQLLLTIVLGASGCATIVTGTTDEVRIDTDPSGAKVELQGNVLTTPATVRLSRSVFNPPEGRASLSGYRDREFDVPRNFNLWTVGNVVTLFLGVPVDVLSGAFFKYPDHYEVLLEPEASND